MIKYKLPTKIVMWENAENMEEVFVDKPLQADFCHDDCIRIKKSGYILLDFGCELRGGIAMTVQLTSKAPQTAKCRIVFHSIHPGWMITPQGMMGADGDSKPDQNPSDTAKKLYDMAENSNIDYLYCDFEGNKLNF